MGRVILGLLKGGVVGAAIGAGAFKLGIGGGVLAIVTYAVVGGLVGILHVGLAAKLGAPDRPLMDLPVLIGPLIGAAWGAFVELDDGGSADRAKAPKKLAK